MNIRGPLAFTAYASSIVGANLLTEHFGAVPVWPHLAATAGTYAAGAALLLRDAVQDLCGWRWVLVGIAAGALLTAATAPGLAIASAIAFGLAELLDMAVYTPLRDRGWARAALLSGVLGAALDTLAFLALAGFPITAGSVGGQLVGKALWATTVPVLVVLACRWAPVPYNFVARQVRRAVLRYSVGA